MKNETEPRVADPGCRRLTINKYTFYNLYFAISAKPRSSSSRLVKRIPIHGTHAAPKDILSHLDYKNLISGVDS